MKCPTCGAEMTLSPVLNHPNKSIATCPNDPTHWEVINEVISPQEWNRLAPAEKSGRVAHFIHHIKSLPPQAPIDLSYLIELARLYQTPVPTFVNGEMSWGQYE